MRPPAPFPKLPIGTRIPFPPVAPGRKPPHVSPRSSDEHPEGMKISCDPCLLKYLARSARLRRTLRAAVISTLIFTATPFFASVKLKLRDGRPLVDGVFVNGHGPYRFLLDTGANVDLMDLRLAQRIGMVPTFHADLASASGSVNTPGSDGNQIALDTVIAPAQKVLFSTLDAIHENSPDIQGVLGQWFLSQFDYTLDLKAKQLTFGPLDPQRDLPVARVPFTLLNGRPILSTSLGDLALDSGQSQLLLFGIEPDDTTAQLHTIAGNSFVGRTNGKPLFLAGRRVAAGNAIAIPTRPEPGVDGLLPLTPFHSIYISNSGSYIVFQ